MKLRQLLCVILTSLVLGPHELPAYEIETHARMSEAAAQASVLRDNSPNGVLQSLGLHYPIHDTTGTQVFPNSKGRSEDIQSLIADGARFEDGLKDDCESRPRHHFYDPVYNRGLQWGIVRGEKSPDWALEDKSDIDGQDFSYKQARVHFYQALTATLDAVRNENFGRTFQTLGHVIHHIQDMAQPQHVRNDIHINVSETCWYKTVAKYVENPSLYERYTDEHPNELSYKADPVTFLNPRAFWANDAGTGIAQFTNRNFVSAGTNFQLLNDQPAVNSTYPDPQPTGDEIPIDIQQLFTEANLPTPRDQNGNLLQGDIVFIGNDVDGAPNSRASTLSIFDQDLKTYNTTVVYDADPFDPTSTGQVIVDRLFTLNQFNFRAAYPFLIPKAVAYSAGLIDYFFRGKLEGEDAIFTETGIALRVRNAIDTKKHPQLKDETLAGDGNLVVTVEYKIPDPNVAGALKTVRWVSMPTPLGETLYPGEMTKQSLAFDLPDIPDGAKEVAYRLAYRGKLGQEEEAVAVGVIKPAAGFLVKPNYVPADGAAEPRMIYRSHGKWKLSDRTDVKAGVLDWKGWYENGKPTEVLSWNGGPMRYSTDLFAYVAGGSPEIYKNGELFAIAPAGVLGAALNRTGGEEWIITVVKIGGTDVVYRRPNKKSSSPALYDSVAEPEGWQELGRYAYPLGMSFGVNPWFFNGEGTEAQTIRHIDAVVQDRLNRLKLTVSGTLVTFQDLQNETGIRIERTNDGGLWSNTEPYPCVKDQSGTASLIYHVTNMQTGKYIVAVDYKNDKEVLATIEGLGGGTFTENSSYAWQTGNCADTRKTSNATDVRHYESNLRLELVIDDTRIKLDNKTDLIDTSTAWEGAFTRLVAGNATASAGRWSLEQLAYLDLRQELYAGIEFVEPNVTSTSEFSSQAGQFCSQKTDLANFRHLVHRISEDIIVQKDPRDYSTQYCRSDNGGTAAPWIYIYALESAEFFPQLAVRRNIIFPTKNSGSWKVDVMGNLAVSQTISPNRGYFNEISAGEFNSIILPAPGEPSYYPINVIR